MPISGNVDVSAKQSLWFAFVTDTVSFEGPEKEDATSIPAKVAIDDGFVNVTIQVNEPGEWWHVNANSSRSGPNGLDGNGGVKKDERGLENEAYKNATYNSGDIGKVTAPLNKLMAMFDVKENGEYKQYPVGEGPTSIDFPGGSTTMFLGFHDGRQWTNNGGDEMDVHYTFAQFLTADKEEPKE